MAGAGARQILLHDDNATTSAGLSDRLKRYYPMTEVSIGSTDPAGFDIVVNATPLGMRKTTHCPSTFRASHLPPLSAGCHEGRNHAVSGGSARAWMRIQVGTDMTVRANTGLFGVLGFPIQAQNTCDRLHGCNDRLRAAIRLSPHGRSLRISSTWRPRSAGLVVQIAGAFLLCAASRLRHC